MTYSVRLHATCLGYERVRGNPCRCCCEGCRHSCAAHTDDHAGCLGPSRLWWSAGWDSPWWRGPLVLIGLRGGDEWCNRTLGLRLPGGVVFLVLNLKLRRESCEECLELYLGEEDKHGERREEH